MYPGGTSLICVPEVGQPADDVDAEQVEDDDHEHERDQPAAELEQAPSA